MERAKSQRRIVYNVDVAIARGDWVWGRKYATFLARQVARLDAAFGKSKLRSKSPQAIRAEETRTVVRRIAAANPTWTVRDVAEAAGIGVSTAHRYMKGDA